MDRYYRWTPWPTVSIDSIDIDPSPIVPIYDDLQPTITTEKAHSNGLGIKLVRTLKASGNQMGQLKLFLIADIWCPSQGLTYNALLADSQLMTMSH